LLYLYLVPLRLGRLLRGLVNDRRHGVGREHVVEQRRVVE